MLRIISNLLIIFSIFLLPQYVTIVLVISAILLFDNFFESIIAGVLLDTIYGSGVVGLDLGYFFTIFITVFYIASFKIKDVLRISL